MVRLVNNHRSQSETQGRRLEKLLLSLPEASQLRIREALVADLEHVPNPLFKSHHAADALFESDLEISPKVPRRSSTSDDDEFFGGGTLSNAMSKHVEQLAFLRYNYARMKTARRLRELKAHPLRKIAGEVDFWYGRVVDAREAIARANLALVLAMSKRTRMTEVDPSELISEGNMALLRAIEKFDVSRGFKFSTYACRAIIKSFSRAAMKTSRYRSVFSAEFDSDLESGDLGPQRHREAAEDAVAELRGILNGNRAELTALERRIIESRFAIGADGQGQDAPRMTLREVGQMVGLTKERVRQIQLHALGKLRTVMAESAAA